MSNKVITSFAGWRDADLDQQAQLIGRKMKGNPYFPTVQDKAAAVAESAIAYHDALLAASSGSHEDHFKKEAQREVLEVALKDLGFSINMLAKGDRIMLESTGYPMAKATTPRRRIKDAISLASGVHSVTLTLNNNTDGLNHVVQYTSVPVSEQSVWTTVYMTDDVLELTGLEGDCKYAFKLAPIVHNQAPVFSEPIVSKYVE